MSPNPFKTSPFKTSPGKTSSVKPGHATVVKNGPAARLIDLGRVGLKHVGLSQSGAADMHAYLWANHLLNNPKNSLAIETAMGQLQLRFETATLVSVTGAKTQVYVNDKPMLPWSTFDIEAGDKLRIRSPESGVYNYVAIKHGFSAIRDPDGKTLGQNDTIAYTPFVRSSSLRHRSCPWHQIPDYEQTLACRFIPDVQFSEFNQKDRVRFLESSYQVRAESNKMGMRLQGAKLRYEGGKAHSQAVNRGTIQIPGSGEPIVLLADHQTIGGYPKLGSVYACDSYQLAQRRPGQTLHFVPGNLVDAQEALRAMHQFFS